jgi:hypothetical protein
MPGAEFKYFTAKTGHLVPRYGTSSYIGATARRGEAATFDGAVVAIPLREWTRFVKEYNRCMKAGVLIECTKAEHDAFLKAQEAATGAAVEVAKAEAEKAAGATKAGPAEAAPAPADKAEKKTKKADAG